MYNSRFKAVRGTQPSMCNIAWFSNPGGAEDVFPAAPKPLLGPFHLHPTCRRVGYYHRNVLVTHSAVYWPGVFDHINYKPHSRLLFSYIFSSPHSLSCSWRFQFLKHYIGINSLNYLKGFLTYTHITLLYLVSYLHVFFTVISCGLLLYRGKKKKHKKVWQIKSPIFHSTSSDL